MKQAERRTAMHIPIGHSVSRGLVFFQFPTDQWIQLFRIETASTTEAMPVYLTQQKLVPAVLAQRNV